MAIGEAVGFSFSPDNDPSLAERLSRFHLFSQDRNRKAEKILRRMTDDLDLLVYEYCYTKGNHVHGQTVILLDSAALQLPALRLCTASWVDRVNEAVLFDNDIDLDSHPTFSERYVLRGGDESAVREVFTPRVLSYLETLRSVCVEAAGGQLVYCSADNLVAPKQLPGFIKEGAQLFALFGYALPRQFLYKLRRSSLTR